MALFKRKNKTDVPEEIQEYYQTERRERAGIAWLLAFGTLIITIVLAAGIFFAGRWTYRKIAGDDNSGTDTTQTAQNEDKQQEEQSSNSSDNSSSNQDSDQQSSEEQKAAEEKQKQEEAKKAEEEQKAKEEKAAQEKAAQEKAQQEAAQSQAGSTSTSSSNQQVATTGDTIPDTGPGDTIAIFFAVSVLGYLLHRLYAAKQNS